MNKTVFTMSLALLVSVLCEERLAAGPPLTLKSYLDQVAQQNGAFCGAEAQARALQLREAEASLDFVPQLVGGANYQDDRHQQLNPIFGTQTISENANLGVQTKLRTGTLIGFSYSSSFSQVNGSTFIPPQGYYINSPNLTLTQPLWKDFNAHLSKASEEAMQFNLKSQAMQQKYMSQQISYNAEIAYWRLALFRQIVKFDQESMERTDKILAWNRRRVTMNVADRSDLLQAMAASKQKELSYQTDMDSLRTTSSRFNSLRGIQGDQVVEELASPESMMEKNFSADIRRMGERIDVKVARLNAQAGRAQARLASERNKPDISLFGTAQFNGRAQDFPTASGLSWNSDFPLYAVGLKMAIPLDFALAREMREGYDASAEAAETLSRRSQFELDQDWHDLQRQFKDVVTRLGTARELENLQKEKLDHERTRFRSGRSTSFQVLQFEDSFSEAQLARLRVENDIVSLKAQARLFNGETQ